MTMPTMSIGAVVAMVCVSAAPSVAQEPSRLGINLGVVGTGQVGVTYQVSSGLALRPGVFLSWREFEQPAPLSSTITTTDYGFSLDLLATVARANTVTSYLGVGGDYIFNHRTTVGNGHTLSASGLMGVRARLIERIHLYGELMLDFSRSRGPTSLDANQVALRTTPLAVLIYLK